MHFYTIFLFTYKKYIDHELYEKFTRYRNFEINFAILCEISMHDINLNIWLLKHFDL